MCDGNIVSARKSSGSWTLTATSRIMHLEYNMIYHDFSVTKNLQVFGLGSCTWSEHCSVILSLSWPFDYVIIWVSQKIFRYLDSNRHSPYHVPWVKMIVFNCSRNELYSYKKKISYQCLLQDLLCLHVVPCLIFCQVLFLSFSLKIGNSLVLRLCVCWLNQKSHQSKISPFSCGFSLNRGSGISAKFPW